MKLVKFSNCTWVEYFEWLMNEIGRGTAALVAERLGLQYQKNLNQNRWPQLHASSPQVELFMLPYFVTVNKRTSIHFLPQFNYM